MSANDYKLSTLRDCLLSINTCQFAHCCQVGLRCKIIGFEDRFEYSVKVTFTVRDENDNFPVFHTLVLENRLPEDSPIGEWQAPHLTRILV